MRVKSWQVTSLCQTLDNTPNIYDDRCLLDMFEVLSMLLAQADCSLISLSFMVKKKLTTVI